METSRFAPSTSGLAHAGTLLAGLLCWLDARSCGARLVLRLEDLDRERCKPGYVESMIDDLAWLGLDWDVIERQSEQGERHESALDRLAGLGLLYPCSCSRATVRAGGQRAPDGSYRYPGHCRERSLPSAAEGGWRASPEAIRLRLPSGRVEVRDEGGRDLALDVAAECGDPVVRRRDGAVAYHLASVVDDHACGVTRIVRGRDLADTTATQVLIARLLGYEAPAYRHHLLLLEEHGGKLAKLHGSVSASDLRSAGLASADVCGALALAACLRSTAAATTPANLLRDFEWSRVGTTDRVLRFVEGSLLAEAADRVA